MDQGLTRQKEINPKDNASILSLVFFTFTTSIFRKGLKRDLQEEDVYDVPKFLKAAKLGDKLEKAWEIERYKSDPWIFRSLFKVFGWELLALAVIHLFANTTLVFFRPLLIGKVVAYFSKDQTEMFKETAYMYTALLIGSITIHTIYSATYNYRWGELNLKVRVALASLIYRKTLKLNAVSLKEMTCGRVVTLLSKDLNLLNGAIESFPFIWIAVVQTAINMHIMYQQVKEPGLIGVGVLLVVIPLHVFLGKQISNARLRTAGKSDKRVRITQEILTAMRIIKMYTWERFFTKQVNFMRKREVHHLKTNYYIKAFIASLGNFTVQIALYVCLVSYLAMGYHLTAEKTYVIVGSLNTLGAILTHSIPVGISDFAEALAALKRITNFLKCEEVQGDFSVANPPKATDVQILLNNVSVSPDSESPVIQNLHLKFTPGLTALTGPVGCGKSTLLKLILKDIPVTQGTVTVNGSISYASQQPWLFPSSVKQNILFGEPLDEIRYQNVVKVCALRKDFESLPYGDSTSVIDKGSNLSSGQKTRINLARAVYKDADIYLLDDSLSSVDTHVGKYIFTECIEGFLKNKLCVFITHQTLFLREINDIIVLGEGNVQYCGQYRKNSVKGLPAGDSHVNECYKEPAAYTENATCDDDNADESSKLLRKAANQIPPRFVYLESNQEGGVSKHIYKDYAVYGGGLKMLLILLTLFISAQVTTSWFDYFVSYWVELEENLSEHVMNGTTNTVQFAETKSNQTTALRMFAVLLILLTAALLTRAFVYFWFSLKAAINIHNAVLNKIINASMIFFDTHMSGNILNRFSRDIGVIDEVIPMIGFECINFTIQAIGVIIVVSSVNPIFLIPSTCLAILLYYISKLYLRIGRSIKRLEGATRSPVIGQLNASIEGLTTIRASKAQRILKREFDAYQDTYNSAQYMRMSTTAAYAFLLDCLCTCYISIVILSLVIFGSNTGGKVGLAVTQALSLTYMLQWGVRRYADLETHMTSVERALEYTKVTPENKFGNKPEKWPSNGKIEYRNVTLRYSESNEPVLKNISFTIEANQKIGVVGRTGAGKSSIISVLFKLYDFIGCIAIDGVDINTIEMDVLRSNIAIIPQDPVLFTDTLRNNLDPNNKYTDKELWDALEEVEMKKFIASSENGLDSRVSEEGSNFSIGQRQLLCLARSILRRKKILVLDEATGNVDLQTDVLIQNAIKRNFSTCTVITVAHRLHTILESDQVLVMDSGRVAEYDDPKELLKNKSGLFYAMVTEAELL